MLKAQGQGLGPVLLTSQPQWAVNPQAKPIERLQTLLTQLLRASAAAAFQPLPLPRAIAKPVMGLPLPLLCRQYHVQLTALPGNTGMVLKSCIGSL